MNRVIDSSGVHYIGVPAITGARAYTDSVVDCRCHADNLPEMLNEVFICKYCGTKYIPNSYNEYQCPYCSAPNRETE